MAAPEADTLTARLGYLCWRPGLLRIYLPSPNCNPTDLQPTIFIDIFVSQQVCAKLPYSPKISTPQTITETCRPQPAKHGLFQRQLSLRQYQVIGADRIPHRLVAALSFVPHPH